MTAVIDGVRAWARGMYSTEAGDELLIRAGRTHDGAPWLRRSADSPGRVWVDTEEPLGCAAAWSGSERRLAAIAASLLAGAPVDLAEELPGLDRQQLVLAAVAHAAGSHQHFEPLIDDAGRWRGSRQLGTAYPWPAPSD